MQRLPAFERTLGIHVQLEEELAEFTGKEDSIVFGTGFQTNYAAIAALAQEGEVILCEHNLHSSLSLARSAPSLRNARALRMPHAYASEALKAPPKVALDRSEASFPAGVEIVLAQDDLSLLGQRGDGRIVGLKSCAKTMESPCR